MSGDYKFGIEEEYFINDSIKRDIARGRIREFFQTCSEHLSEDIQPEMLEPQVEIASTPVTGFRRRARRSSSNLRSLVGAIAREHNLSIMASGTHPLAVWSRVSRRRSRATARSCTTCRWSGAGRSFAACMSMWRCRIFRRASIIMNRIQRYLPLLLALSTSSPFWQSQRTGLLGYRLAAYRELPRTGFPEPVRGRCRITSATSTR